MLLVFEDEDDTFDVEVDFLIEEIVFVVLIVDDVLVDELDNLELDVEVVVIVEWLVLRELDVEVVDVVGAKPSV